MSQSFRQSAVIPFRYCDGVLQVLLITSSDGRRWVVPKGMLEPGLGPAESAAKEAFEEAGVRGRVSDLSVGSYEYRKWGGPIEVQVFLLEVQEELTDWPEAQVRRRVWLTVEQAVQRVSVPGLGALLEEVLRLV